MAPDDAELVWAIVKETNDAGDSFPFEDDSADAARALFTDPAPGIHRYVAEFESEISGVLFLKPNLPGRCAHIANAGYAVSKRFRGKGVGRALGEFSLHEAKRLGYSAMQFNSVVAVNDAAVELWRSLGFRIIGTVPSGFRHQSLGLVDLHIMYREIGDI